MADDFREARSDMGANSPADDKPDEREVLTAKLSSYAAEGWRSFCASNGITVTAMLEVVCRELGADKLPPTIEGRQQLVASAREVDRLRRSRPRRK